MKVSTYKENSIFLVRPELLKEWDFEKNILEHTLATKGMMNKAYWICTKCGSSYHSAIYARANGQDCPYCAGKKVNHTNSLASLMPHIAELWDYNKNKVSPEEVSIGTKKKYWWHCKKCNDSYPMSVNKKTSGRGCSICAGYYVTHKSSFGYNYPQLLEEWDFDKNKKSPYEVSCGSGYKAIFKCKNCSNNYTSTIDKKVSRNSSCRICTEYRSFGERMFYELLYTNNIKFVIEKSFSWSNRKRYDFYLEDFNCIVEIHGEQHYGKNFSINKARDYNQEKSNDTIKRNLAKENGISHYFEFKVTNMDLEELRDSILSTYFLDLVDIKTDKIYEINKFTTTNITKIVWDMWNNEHSIQDIVKEVKYSESTVRKIIKNGNILQRVVYPKG